MISPESVIIAIFLSELSVVAAASVVAASVVAASVVAAASVVEVSAADGVSVSAELLPHPTKDATIAEARTSDNAFFFIKIFPPLNSTHITKTWPNYLDIIT